MTVTALGFIAGILTTSAYIPQVVKAFRTKHTKDISLPMYVTAVTGIILWIFYGLLIKDINITVFNCFTLLLTGSILVLKLKDG